MSATTHDETYSCQHCGDDRTPATSVRGSFCSATCSFRQYGQQALRRLYSDHRFCGSCFRRIKTTSRPAENTLRDARVSRLVRESFVGYQSRTPAATVGVDEFGCIGDNEAVRIEGTRLSCECGTVDPQDRHEVLRRLDIRETVVALWHALVELERAGALDQRPNRDDYFGALREHGPDFEYAVGRALHAAPE
jgi:hypothetical protein